MKLKIISGGQTGADMGGLLAARDLGIETGGTAPKGWLQEEGGAKEELLRSFGLVECLVPGYPARTEQNVKNSDLTLIFSGWGNYMSPGCRATWIMCKKLRKDVLVYNPFHPFSSTEYPLHVYNYVKRMRRDVFRPLIINIAGSRESSNPGIEAVVYALVRETIEKVKGLP